MEDLALLEKCIRYVREKFKEDLILYNFSNAKQIS